MRSLDGLLRPMKEVGKDIFAIIRRTPVLLTFPLITAFASINNNKSEITQTQKQEQIDKSYGLDDVNKDGVEDKRDYFDMKVDPEYVKQLEGKLVLSKSIQGDTNKYLNTFAQPDSFALADAYGSGDVNEDWFLRRDDLEYMKQFKPQNNQSDINGDGIKSDSLDIKLLEDLFSGKIDYLPGHFNSFPVDSLRVKRNDWGVKMVTINQTDTIPNISPEFDCGEHAVMNLLRLRGYNGDDIPNIYYTYGYDDSQNGESNLPVYIAGFYPLDGSQGHATNAMYIGPDSSDTEIDVTDPYQWLFFESLHPEDRFFYNVRGPPRDSKIWVHGVERFTDSGAPFKFTILGWETDSEGNISLIYQHPDLVEAPTDMPTINVDTTNVAIAEDLAVPSEYSLNQNYPNPFNPTTTISYSIPKGGHVLLSVYNLRGQELETLVNQEQSPGEYKVPFDASKHPSGIYFYRLEAGDYTEIEKMLLVK